MEGEFRAFLCSVDVHHKRRPDDVFLNAAVTCLAANGFHCMLDLIDADAKGFIKTADGAQQAFLARAVRAANKAALQDEIPKPVDAAGVASKVIKDLRKEDPSVHVNMDMSLVRVSLAVIPFGCRPKGETVDALATEVAKLKNKGIAAPFICVNLKKYLPGWAGVRSEESDDDAETPPSLTELAKFLGTTKKKERPLTILQWVSAFDRYMLAAQATNPPQWNFESASQHKDNVLRIAAQAGLKSDPTGIRRKHCLAVVYDETCRKRWAERLYSDSTFNINNETSEVLCIYIFIPAMPISPSFSFPKYFPEEVIDKDFSLL